MRSVEDDQSFQVCSPEIGILGQIAMIHMDGLKTTAGRSMNQRIVQPLALAQLRLGLVLPEIHWAKV